MFMGLLKHLFLPQLHVQPSRVLSAEVTQLSVTRPLPFRSLLEERGGGGGLWRTGPVGPPAPDGAVQSTSAWAPVMTLNV